MFNDKTISDIFGFILGAFGTAALASLFALIAVVFCHLIQLTLEGKEWPCFKEDKCQEINK